MDKSLPRIVFGHVVVTIIGFLLLSILLAAILSGSALADSKLFSIIPFSISVAISALLIKRNNITDKNYVVRNSALLFSFLAILLLGAGFLVNPESFSSGSFVTGAINAVIGGIIMYFVSKGVIR